MSRGKKWSVREDSRLVNLRKSKRLKWSDIATALPPRTANACQARFYYLLTDFTALERNERLAETIAMAPPAPAVDRPYVPASGRVVPTSILLADAELRARIAVLGITAGLLGDPAPGRSALDIKRAGGAEAVRVTLPTGPLA